jgi:undecaprenyl-diphosphatase
MLTKLLELDARWSDRVRVAERPGPKRRIAAFLAHSGDSWFWLPGLLGLWLVGDAEWKTLAIRLGIGIVLTAGGVFAIKFTVRRQRPAGEWGGIYRKTDPHSFPSGHAARALMLSAMGVILGPWWLGAILAVWGPLVALARAAMGVHYVSDVVAGAVLGLMLGLAFGIAFPVWPMR